MSLKIIHVFAAGPETGPDVEYKFNHIPSLNNYKTFLSRVDAKDTVNIRITYKTGDTVSADVLMLGKKMGAAQRRKKNTIIVAGKQSGKTIWTEAN